ncbi:fibronectin type III domain-containing protein [Pontibacter kalidii]|uniref:fibronectin type III domain-containing protein n=1 Tax=Pontibacter kalidii TaxID=2592049 RepID=UPI0022565CE8|nr:fibronectin type III domain-containing protein [Pontibacter kalidii]
MYRISIEVEDYSRRQLVSNAGAAVLSAFMSYPPVINQPFPDAKVTALFPQNLVFQWMPRHTASFNAAFNIVYRLRLVEVNPAGRDQNDAMRSSRPLFETITHLTQYVYGPSEPQLVPGNTYALQVQALDADGKDAFVNQGYSEVVRFVYGEKCAVPISVLAQLQDKNSLQLSWAQLPMQQRYSVRYREANNSKAEWFEQEVYTTQFNARGLRPGATYEYQVKAACDYGYGDYTLAQQFTMPNEAVTTGDIVCGEPSSVKAPTNKELLPLLQPGMVFFAGSFPVHVTEVQGGGERFTGRGTIGVPYLNKLNFAVEFKDIQINTDLKLINGKVSIAKQSLEQSQEGVKQAITVAPDENGVVEAIASNGLPTIIDVAVAVPATLPTYHAKDKTVTFTGLINNGTSKEITIKLKDGQPPLLFQDKNGETYEVAQDGKVTHKGKFSTAEMLAGGGLTNKLLSTDKATVAFMAAPDQKYGLDLFQQSLASNSRYKEAYQQVPTSQGSAYVSWKSVEAGAGDVVVAEITNASVDLDKLEFRTGKGDKLTSGRKGKQFTISLVGAPEGNDREIYAFYPTGTDGKEGLNLGKLNIASFKKITKKVVIVPVNGAGEHLTAAAIRTHLNSIYKQAVVDWEVTTADNFMAYTDGEDGWDLDRNGLDVGSSSMASAYTAEQKKLAGLYAKKHTLQDKTYYLFLVNRFSDPGQKGYMVRGGQVGFVKVPSHDPETDAAVLLTMAHELGHGAFNLQHTWEVYGADTQGRTNNLMDYGLNLGTGLSYAQWKYMRNPDVIFRPFEGDDEGAYLGSEYFIALNGYPIHIPDADIGALLVPDKDDKTPYPDGALYGFETSDKIKYRAEIKDGVFIGYKSTDPNKPNDIRRVKKLTQKEILVQFIKQTNNDCIYEFSTAYYTTPTTLSDRVASTINIPVKKIDSQQIVLKTCQDLTGDGNHLFNYTNRYSADDVRAAISDLVKISERGLTPKIFVTDANSQSDRVADIKNQFTQLGEKEIALWVHYDESGKATLRKYHVGKQNLPAESKGLLDVFGKVLPSMGRDFNPLTAVLDGLTGLIKNLELPEKYWNAGHEDYDPVFFKIYSYTKVAQADLRVFNDINVGGYPSQQLEFAFVSGAYNGLIQTVAGIPDLGSLIIKVITNEDNARVNFFDTFNKIQEFCGRTNLEVYIAIPNAQAVGYGKCLWDVIQNQFTEGNACQISYNSGNAVFQVVTVAIAFAKVGTLARVSEIMNILDPLNITLQATFKVAKPIFKAGRNLYKVGKRYATVVIQDGRYVTRFTDDAGNILNDFDLDRLQWIEFTDPASGNQMRLGLDIEPSAVPAVKEQLASGKLQVQVGRDPKGKQIIIDGEHGLAELNLNGEQQYGVVARFLDDLSDAWLAGWNKERVLAFPKNDRPLPRTYLSEEYILRHISKFEKDGAAFVIRKRDITQGRSTLAPRKFVGLKPEMDVVISRFEESGKDLKVLVNELDLGDTYFLPNDEVYLVTIPAEQNKFIYGMPNGNEFGAYDGLWEPGGKTKHGTLEAVIVNLKDFDHNNDWKQFIDIFGAENVKHLK